MADNPTPPSAAERGTLRTRLELPDGETHLSRYTLDLEEEVLALEQKVAELRAERDGWMKLIREMVESDEAIQRARAMLDDAARGGEKDGNT